jgi:hypothetical protein
LFEAVAAFTLGPLPGVGHSLPDLLDFDPEDFSDVRAGDLLALVTAADPRSPRDPKTARHLAAAGYSAWLRRSAGGPGPAPDELADRICRAIVASKTDALRSVGPPEADYADAAADAGVVLAGLFVTETDA